MGELVDVLVFEGGQDARQLSDVLQVLDTLAVGPAVGGIVKARSDCLERDLRLVEPDRTHTAKLCTPTDNPTDKPCRPTYFSPGYPQPPIHPQIQNGGLTNRNQEASKKRVTRSMTISGFSSAMKC